MLILGQKSCFLGSTHFEVPPILKFHNRTDIIVDRKKRKNKSWKGVLLTVAKKRALRVKLVISGGPIYQTAVGWNQF